VEASQQSGGVAVTEPSATELPWLQALDREVFSAASNAVALESQLARLAGALAEITVSMALDAGYATPEALVSERYANAFNGAEPKIIQPALRKAGFSQSATGLMCGVSKQAVKKGEQRARNAARSGDSVPLEDHLPPGGSKDLETAHPVGGIADTSDPTRYNLGQLKTVALDLLKRATAQESEGLAALFADLAIKAAQKAIFKLKGRNTPPDELTVNPTIELEGAEVQLQDIVLALRCLADKPPRVISAIAIQAFEGRSQAIGKIVIQLDNAKDHLEGIGAKPGTCQGCGAKLDQLHRRETTCTACKPAASGHA
jgi:hypothetical protein